MRDDTTLTTPETPTDTPAKPPAKLRQLRRSKQRVNSGRVYKRAERTFYPSYNFRDHDPVLDQIQTLIELCGMTMAALSVASGVSTGTFANWMKRKTKRPQFATIVAAARAMGADVIVTSGEGRKVRRTKLEDR